MASDEDREKVAQALKFYAGGGGGNGNGGSGDNGVGGDGRNFEPLTVGIKVLKDGWLWEVMKVGISYLSVYCVAPIIAGISFYKASCGHVIGSFGMLSSLVAVFPKLWKRAKQPAQPKQREESAQVVVAEQGKM